jgi:transposase
VPHGHWKTTTFICGLRYDGITAPFVLDGPMDGPHFLAYVEQVLAATLKKGQIVFLDNVSTHKVDGVEEAIEARGAFLPAYSPDLNPIEQLFARLKSFLRKMKARTIDELWRAIAFFLKGVSKEECRAYLAMLAQRFAVFQKFQPQGDHIAAVSGLVVCMEKSSFRGRQLRQPKRKPQPNGKARLGSR